MKLILKIFLYVAAVLVASYFLPGISVSGGWASVEGWKTAGLVALVLTVMTFTIKPILFVFTLPINLITFGLFSLVINGALLYWTPHFVPGFLVGTFLDACIGAAIISFCHFVINKILDED